MGKLLVELVEQRDQNINPNLGVRAPTGDEDERKEIIFFEGLLCVGLLGFGALSGVVVAHDLGAELNRKVYFASFLH